MSGPHEEHLPAAPAPRADDQPGLVESVPLFPAGAPPVPPLPAEGDAAPEPLSRRSRAAAREARRPEPEQSFDEALEMTVPRRPTPETATPPLAPETAAPAPFAPAPVAPAPVARPQLPQPQLPQPSAPAAPPASAALPRPDAPPLPAAPPLDPGFGPVLEPVSRREQRSLTERHSFLQTERPEEPAREGTRGVLNRLGLRVRPSAQEQSARDDELAVSQHWPGPRTIAVVNGKGGAGKTPTTILLSAVFARYGGAGVLAWDNNQTRGTLGWRTDTGAHDRTLLEMLPEADRLLGTGAQSADLAHFMHHQPREKYDVLRSKPIRLAHENRLSPDDVDAIHAVAAKFYRLIIIDSGNDESDPMWLRMIDHADQLVIATTTRADHAEAGALLIEALEERDERSARLAQNSVVVVSQADPKASAADVEHVVTGYRTLARDVVTVPFDHEMVDGHLRYGALAKRTQRAWLAAAASVARGL